MGKRVLVAHPDRYGRFGHQTTSIYAALALAKLTDSLLLNPRYMYFADRWNKEIDWSKSIYTTNIIDGERKVVYLEKSSPDKHGNRKWNLAKSELKELVKTIDSIPLNTIVNLPFDQSAGSLMYLACRYDMKEDLNRIFDVDNWRIAANRYTCIHIRRGDCTPQRHPEWYVEDAFYVELIKKLDKLLPQDMPIVICTQGRLSVLEKELEEMVKRGKLQINTTDNIWSNDNEINDFKVLSSAEILFTARSSFSRWAGLVGPEKLVIDINRLNLTRQGETMIINPDAERRQWEQRLEGIILNKLKNNTKHLGQ